MSAKSRLIESRSYLCNNTALNHSSSNSNSMSYCSTNYHLVTSTTSIAPICTFPQSQMPTASHKQWEYYKLHHLGGGRGGEGRMHACIVIKTLIAYSRRNNDKYYQMEAHSRSGTDPYPQIQRISKVRHGARTQIASTPKSLIIVTHTSQSFS